MGSIFLIIGIALATFPIQVIFSTVETTLDEWGNIWSLPYVLPWSSGPSWTLGMPEESFFQLNVSASDTVRLRIGTPYYDNDTGEEILKNLIFDEVGTRFTQKVAVGETGTYQMEIANEGTTPVGIGGNVLAEKTVTTYQTVHPYLSLGTLVVLGGLTSFIYGALTKSRRKRAKTPKPEKAR